MYQMVCIILCKLDDILRSGGQWQGPHHNNVSQSGAILTTDHWPPPGVAGSGDQSDAGSGHCPRQCEHQVTHSLSCDVLTNERHLIGQDIPWWVGAVSLHNYIWCAQINCPCNSILAPINFKSSLHVKCSEHYQEFNGRGQVKSVKLKLKLT